MYTTDRDAIDTVMIPFRGVTCQGDEWQQSLLTLLEKPGLTEDTIFGFGL